MSRISKAAIVASERLTGFADTSHGTVSLINESVVVSKSKMTVRATIASLQSWVSVLDELNAMARSRNWSAKVELVSEDDGCCMLFSIRSNGTRDRADRIIRLAAEMIDELGREYTTAPRGKGQTPSQLRSQVLDPHSDLSKERRRRLEATLAKRRQLLAKTT